MQVSGAARLCLEYHKSHSKENSMRAYKLVLTKLCEEFGHQNLEEITTEKILSFLTRITEGCKQQTKRSRYSHLLAFFNFVKNNLDQESRNPCDTPMLKKLFRARLSYHWDIIEQWHPHAALVHTPIHASWLNRVGIYFSIFQRKLLTPNDFKDLEELQARILSFQSLYDPMAEPFKWKFSPKDLKSVLAKLADQKEGQKAVAQNTSPNFRSRGLSTPPPGTAKRTWLRPKACT